MSLVGEFSIAGVDNRGILGALDVQRNEVQFCDVVLCVEAEKYPAHRCVLAAASPYFRSMFEEYHFTESRTKEVALKGDTVATKAVEVILDVVYSGVLKLDANNMHQVLAAADHFLMTEVKFACAEFMLMVLNSETASEEALKIRRSAELYSLTDLEHQADRVITQTFANVARSAAFCDLLEQELLSFLQSDYIQEGDEHVFWQAALQWVQHDLEERGHLVDKLMECVRFPLIEPSILVGVIEEDDLMAKSERCKEMVQEAMKYQLLPRFQSSLQNSRTKPRCTIRDTVIYCLSDINQFKCYVPLHNKWYSLQAPQPLDPKAMEVQAGGRTTEQSLVSVSGTVYACTQATRPQEVGHFEMIRLQLYSLDTNKWKDCNLPTKVGVPTFLIECNNMLYACSRNAVERYRSDQDRWEIVSISRLSPCQFAVSDDNRILLYALEEGISQEVCMDQPDMVTTRQVTSPNRFVSNVISATKLANHEVFLSMRTLSGSGISRKIFNVKSNLWRDAGIFHGISTLQPRPGQHYPLWLDPSEPWQTMSDRPANMLYVLGSKSGLSDVPATNITSSEPGSRREHKGKDAVLPFFRIDLQKKTWKRLACLPEFMGAGAMHTCISDGQSSMGNASAL